MGKNYIELCKGTVRWYYHIKSSNGNTLSTSQKYWSKGNAKRAARQEAHVRKCKLITNMGKRG